jgi:hypothetical protein
MTDGPGMRSSAVRSACGWAGDRRETLVRTGTRCAIFTGMRSCMRRVSCTRLGRPVASALAPFLAAGGLVLAVASAVLLHCGRSERTAVPPRVLRLYGHLDRDVRVRVVMGFRMPEGMRNDHSVEALVEPDSQDFEAFVQLRHPRCEGCRCTGFALDCEQRGGNQADPGTPTKGGGLLVEFGRQWAGDQRCLPLPPAIRLEGRRFASVVAAGPTTDSGHGCYWYQDVTTYSDENQREVPHEDGLFGYYCVCAAETLALRLDLSPPVASDSLDRFLAEHGHPRRNWQDCVKATPRR